MCCRQFCALARLDRKKPRQPSRTMVSKAGFTTVAVNTSADSQK